MLSNVSFTAHLTVRARWVLASLCPSHSLCPAAITARSAAGCRQGWASLVMLMIMMIMITGSASTGEGETSEPQEHATKKAR
eukprot:1519502-Rhodomonas_salina.1